MVYAEGQLGPTVKHDSLQSALTEAKRLCKQINAECYVLAAVRSFKIHEFIETTFVDHPLPF